MNSMGMLWKEYEGCSEEFIEELKRRYREGFGGGWIVGEVVGMGRVNM